MDEGLLLAKNLGAKVTIVTVTESVPIYAGQRYALQSADLQRLEIDREAVARQILDPVETRTSALGIACETKHLSGRPAEAIIDHAMKTHASLIVMTSHGRRGVRKLLLGSQTQAVLVIK